MLQKMTTDTKGSLTLDLLDYSQWYYLLIPTKTPDKKKLDNGKVKYLGDFSYEAVFFIKHLEGQSKSYISLPFNIKPSERKTFKEKTVLYVAQVLITYFSSILKTNKYLIPASIINTNPSKGILLTILNQITKEYRTPGRISKELKKDFTIEDLQVLGLPMTISLKLLAMNFINFYGVNLASLDYKKFDLPTTLKDDLESLKCNFNDPQKFDLALYEHLVRLLGLKLELSLTGNFNRKASKPSEKPKMTEEEKSFIKEVTNVIGSPSNVDSMKSSVSKPVNNSLENPSKSPSESSSEGPRIKPGIKSIQIGSNNRNFTVHISDSIRAQLEQNKKKSLEAKGAQGTQETQGAPTNS